MILVIATISAASNGITLSPWGNAAPPAMACARGIPTKPEAVRTRVGPLLSRGEPRCGFADRQPLLEEWADGFA